MDDDQIRRHALTIAAQLPPDLEDAIAILRWAEKVARLIATGEEAPRPTIVPLRPSA